MQRVDGRLNARVSGTHKQLVKARCVASQQASLRHQKWKFSTVLAHGVRCPRHLAKITTQLPFSVRHRKNPGTLLRMMCNSAGITFPLARQSGEATAHSKRQPGCLRALLPGCSQPAAAMLAATTPAMKTAYVASHKIGSLATSTAKPAGVRSLTTVWCRTTAASAMVTCCGIFAAIHTIDRALAADTEKTRNHPINADLVRNMLRPCATIDHHHHRGGIFRRFR